MLLQALCFIGQEARRAREFKCVFSAVRPRYVAVVDSQAIGEAWSMFWIRYLLFRLALFIYVLALSGNIFIYICLKFLCFYF